VQQISMCMYIICIGSIPVKYHILGNHLLSVLRKYFLNLNLKPLSNLTFNSCVLIIWKILLVDISVRKVDRGWESY
jgi:hypothetical protein